MLLRTCCFIDENESDENEKPFSLECDVRDGLRRCECDSEWMDDAMVCVRTSNGMDGS